MFKKINLHYKTVQYFHALRCNLMQRGRITREKEINWRMRHDRVKKKKKEKWSLRVHKHQGRLHAWIQSERARAVNRGSPVRFAFLPSTRVLVFWLSPTTASRADSRTEYILYPVYPILCYPYPSVCDRSKPSCNVCTYHVHAWRLSKVSWTIANFFRGG